MLEKIKLYVESKDLEGLYNECLIKIEDIDSIPELNERQYQYVCAALLNNGQYSSYVKVANVALKKFPRSISILNLHSIYFFRTEDYNSSYRVVEKIIDIAGGDFSKLEKVLKRKQRLEKYVKQYESSEGTTIVHASEELVVKYNNKNRSDVLFITFWGSQASIKSGPGVIDKLRSRPGYAESFVLNNGYDLVSVIKRKYFFYQDLDREALQSIVKKLIGKYKKVYMYGGSGGGYAALYYSIGIDVIPIVFSPRIRIDPITKMAVRDEHPKLSHELLSSYTVDNKAYVFYDPKHISDHSYIQHRVRPCFKNSVITELPFSGHGAFMLGELGVVKDLINNIVRTGEVDLDYSLRKRSIIYHFHLASHLFKIGKLGSGLLVSIRGLNLPSQKKLKFDKINIYNILIRELRRAGRHEFALELFKEYKKESWFLDPNNKYSSL